MSSLPDESVSGPFELGDKIKERQHNGYERIVTDIVPGHYILTMRAGRRTRISWRNLHRYELVESWRNAR